MNLKTLVVVTVAAFLVAGFAEATCTPAIGYVEFCQSACIGSTAGGTCESNPDLAQDAYCLTSSWGTCLEGSHDDCCSGRHIY